LSHAVTIPQRHPLHVQAPGEIEDASRRTTLTSIFGSALFAALSATQNTEAHAATAGRLKQSVCRWPYRAVELPELCRRVKRMGFAGIDLLHVDEWQVAHDAGLTVSMGYPSRREKFIETGFNNPAHHALLLNELETALPLAARAGVPNLIAMFGNRDAARDDRAAIDSCIAGLAKIAPLAEESHVTLCVELLNSRIDHPGYQGDHTAFGVAVMQGVNSQWVKLLYDIYHMQIMEGDVIRTIRDNIQWIGHFHTGGVPGRHEIDASQELNYRAIATAIADLGYAGYVAHEFLPTRADPYASLAEALRICSV
jgi:hydroxypyruvate isomerase